MLFLLLLYDIISGLSLFDFSDILAKKSFMEFSMEFFVICKCVQGRQQSTPLNLYAHAFDSTKRAASERLKQVLKT